MGEWATISPKHTQTKVRGDTVYATQMDGGKESEVERVCPAGDRARGVICERSPVSR